MNTVFSRIFLALSVVLVILVSAWLLAPSGSGRYHLVLTGVGKGRIHPYRAKFEPYRGKKMGGAAGVATVIKETVASFSGEPFNIVSIGSEISGTADAYFTRGSAVIAALNGVGIELMLIGNIEFTFGQERLRELKKEADFVFLSSNVSESGTGQTPDYISPEVILYPGGGLRIGVVGLTPPSTPDLTSKGNVSGLEFALPGSDLKTRIDALRKAGVDLVVLLTLYDRSRISSEEWSAIAQAHPDICVLLDYEIEEPPAITRDGVVIKTVSGYNQSKEIDVLDLEISGRPAKILSFSGRRLAVNHAEIDPDPKMVQVVEAATRKVQLQKKERIADFSADYQREYSTECPIGNMITDAMRHETGTEIAMQNSGGIQSDISSGEFTLGDLFNVLPFDNQVVTIDLSGSDLLELLTQSASRRRGILQVSGLTYSYANRSNDDYELKEALIDNESIIATRTYSVSTNSFLSDGGDNFLAFRNGRNLKYGRQQRDVVNDYLKMLGRQGEITLPATGRIRVEQ